jgi:hypothetical protein
MVAVENAKEAEPVELKAHRANLTPPLKNWVSVVRGDLQ